MTFWRCMDACAGSAFASPHSILPPVLCLFDALTPRAAFAAAAPGG